MNRHEYSCLVFLPNFMTTQRVPVARYVRAMLSLCIMAQAACGGSDSTAPEQQVAAVSTLEFTTPPSQFMVKGTTQQLSIAALDPSGKPLTGRQITWESSDNAVATVSANGLVTALTTGLTSISATSEGRAASFPLRVDEAVGEVNVEFDEDILEAGKSYQLRTRVRDSKGVIIASPTLSWSTSNATVATVSNSGMLTVAGTHNDSVVISATIGGKVGRFRFFSWPALTDGVPIKLDGPADKSRWFVVRLPAGVNRLTVSTNGGSGDADLYVWSPGTWSGATQMCESVSETATEQCVITTPQPGLWSIEVYGYSEYHDVQILAVKGTP